MKKEAKIKPFWYSDIWLFPKLITIITTLDEQGRVNAAPYSHIMQYDVMAKHPRMIVGSPGLPHVYEHRRDGRVRRELCLRGQSGRHDGNRAILSRRGK